MEQAAAGVGPVLAPFEGVRRIAVLRGGGLGDVLFAVPAIEALAAAYPQATITLLGTPLHAALFAGRPGPVAEVEVLPFAEGVRPGTPDPVATGNFLSRMRARRFDLAVQVHGGGRNSNPFLLAIGARHTVGTGTPDATQLERTLPYLYYQHEVLRALEVAGLAGAAPVALEPRVQVTDGDLAEGRRALAAAGIGGTRPLLVLHPGATDERRRWPADRFGTLARWAAEDGFDVVVVGDDSERPLAAEVLRVATDDDAGPAADAGRREPAGAWGADPGRQLEAVPPVAHAPGEVRSLAGEISLGGLVGVLARAAAVVGNDSGPRHLAQAVGAPSVGIYWIGNAMMASPLGRAEHRIHLGWATHCPVCGHDVTQLGWTAPDCGHVFCLTEAVRPQDVYADVLSLQERRQGRGWPEPAHGQDPSSS